LLGRLFLRRGLALGLLLAFALLLLGCYPDNPQSTFDPKGPVARNQLTLFWVIFWASVVVFAIVAGILIYSVIKFRYKGENRLPVQVHGNRNLEVLWTVVPALLLVAIAVMTVRTIFELDEAPSDDQLIVDVYGHQWWWEAVYPQYAVSTANEIHVPVGRDVTVNLISDDVIHSFWVPKLAGKEDVIPNEANDIWFRADEPGIYLGQCAEFCGIAHALMKFRVVASPMEEFEDWVASQQAPARQPANDEAARGLAVFNSKGCVACHTTTGGFDTAEVRDARTEGFLTGQPVTHGPNLTHFATRDVFAGAIADSTEGNLRAWLEDPEEFKPGNRMAALAPAFKDPSLRLSEEEITALIAYLQSLK